MIVIADNDDSTRMVLRYSLERAGYEVDEVMDGQMLWPAIERTDVNLLILDLRMPEMNGWEVLRRLRDGTPGETPRAMPVIVVSGQSDPETRQFTSRLGAAAFVPKPIDLKEFARVVRGVLRTAHA
jgi:two-component system response regulator MprA